MKSRITRQLLTSSLPVFPLWIRTFSLLLSFLLLAVALPAYRKIFTCALAVLLWELCHIRHKPSYKIQFSLCRPLSFQYTSINRQRLINVSPFRQSNKKLLASFAITSGTKRNSVTVKQHSPHYENALACEFLILLHVIAKDGSRFVIPLSERKMLGFYWKDKERIEFYRMMMMNFTWTVLW